MIGFPRVTEKHTATLTEKTPATPRNTLLHEQDMMMDAQFKKLDIRQYMLFVNREGHYQLANWRGHQSPEVDALVFDETSLIVELLRSRPYHHTLDKVKSYYEDDVFLPGEFQSLLGSELRLWQHLSVTDFFPLVDSNSGLFGFVLAGMSKPRRGDTQWVDALRPHLFSWGRHYHDLYAGYEAKYERARMADFVSFVQELGEEPDSDRHQDHILRYILKAHGATKGILFERRAAAYQPIRALHVDQVKTYDRSIIDPHKKLGELEVRDSHDPFYDELGLGSVKLFALSDKLLIAMKQVFHHRLSKELLSSVLAISRKVLECRNSNKSK